MSPIDMNTLEKIKKLCFKAKDALFGFLGQSGRPFHEDIEYKPETYWQERHSKYGFDLRGVGNCTYSHEENERIYIESKKIFFDLCKRDKIDFSFGRSLEIGCGTGLFTQAFLEAGGKDLLAIDITDSLFNGLEKKFPNVVFRMFDITKEELGEKYDQVMMIDVTQHIINDDDFAFSMRNIYSHLNKGGVFIVTSWLSKGLNKRTFYEIERPLSYYESAFPNCQFSDPVVFREKYLFSIRKKV